MKSRNKLLEGNLGILRIDYIKKIMYPLYWYCCKELQSDQEIISNCSSRAIPNLAPFLFQPLT